ncbi:hypothetical protein ACIBJI_32420 [Nocardia sp. NPDC050408]|uniref:hypothetical protein n=1 Tax=Nocardia sp. NPDC050408 TaxID=3364319 RepID=UPI00379DAA67
MKFLDTPTLRAAVTRAWNSRATILGLGPRSGVPLVLLNRFRGTIDWWDPQLLDHLTRHRDNPRIRAFVLSLSI